MKNKIEKKIYVKLTENCNMNCDHCYVKTISEQRAVMLSVQKALDYIIRYMNYWYTKLRDKVSFNISFHGGEPFLNLKSISSMKEIIDLIRSKTSIKFSTDATTNLMSECFSSENIYDTTDFISKYFYNLDLNKSFLKISYDFGDLRFKNNIDEAQFVERAKQIRSLSCNSIKLKVNICLSTKFLDFVKNYGILAVYHKIYDIVGEDGEAHFEYLTKNTTPDRSLVPSSEEIDKIFFYPFYRVFGNKQHSYLVDNFEDILYALKGEYIGCRARQCMYNVITINPSGRITGCPNTVKSFATIDDAIYEPKKDFELVVKERNVRMECMLCKYYKVCHGGCFQLAENGCTFPKVTADFIIHQKKNNLKTTSKESKDYNTINKIFKHKATDDEIVDFLRDNQNSKLTPQVTIEDQKKTIYKNYELHDLFEDLNKQILRGTCDVDKIPLKAYYVHLVYSAGAASLYGLSFRRSLALMTELLADQYGIDKASALSYPKYIDMIYDLYKDSIDIIISNNDMTYFKNEFGWNNHQKIYNNKG